MLAEFIIEFTLPTPDLEAKYWTMYAEGLFVTSLESFSVIVTSLEKDALKYEVQLQFPTTNNVAKYEVILTSLRIAKALGVKNLKLRTDNCWANNQQVRSKRGKNEEILKANKSTG